MVAGASNRSYLSKNSSVRAVMATRCASARSSCSTVSFRPSSMFQITSGLSRSRFVRNSAAYGIEQQGQVFHVARHRALDTEIAIDRRGYRMRDAADARPQSDDAAEARGIA